MTGMFNDALSMLEIWFFNEFRMIPGYTILTCNGRDLSSCTRSQALGRIAYSTLMVKRFLIPGFLGVCWGYYLFHHFSKGFIPKKEVFKFTTPNCPCSPSNPYRHLLDATNIWILNSKTLGIWIQFSGAAGRVISDLFFKYVGT
jgi:hypothetical protein